MPAKAQIKKEPEYYFACMEELLQSAPKFLQFNKQLLKRAVQDKKFDEDKHLHVAENALIELIKLCEPLSTK